MARTQANTPRIVLHVFGKQGHKSVPTETLEVVRATLQDRFLLKALWGEVLPYPEDSFSERRGQYLSTDFLFEMDTRYSGDGDFHLGITDVDLYVPELNFVFGEASMTGRSAVLSSWRLDTRSTLQGPSESSADTRLLTLRAATEAVHEIGHLIGLTHCQRPDCVMWFSNTLAETDRKGSRFCIDHQRDLSAKLKSLADRTEADRY